MTGIYRCAGLTVRCDLPLAAPPATGPVDVTVLDGGRRPVPFERPTVDVVAERLVDGVPSYTFSRLDDGTVVGRVYGLADFDIDPGGRSVRYHCDPAVDVEFVSILVVGTLSAYLLSARGALVLHASAVAVGDRALAFIGASGQGKTTMATLLCLAGYPLITDDVLPVHLDGAGAPWCIPGGVELRVRDKLSDLVASSPGSMGRRRTADQRSALAPPVTGEARLPLGAVVVPWPDRETSGLRAERLGFAQATMALARFQRIEGWRRPEALRAQFDQVGAVAAAVPVIDMRVPWGPPFADGVAAAVVEASGLVTPATVPSEPT